MNRWLSVQVNPPGVFRANRWLVAGPDGVLAEVGVLNEQRSTLFLQRYLFPLESWTVQLARAWVSKHLAWKPTPNGETLMNAVANAANTTQLREDLLTFTKPKKVDAEVGLVEDVKILGLTSPTRARDYTPDALKNALKMFEGAPVNVNHPGATGQRPAQDRFGQVKNVRFVEGDGIRGDLQFNPKHSWAPAFAHFAEHMPNVLGFSQDSIGKTFMRSGRQIVSEITKVRSVDVVAEPATTKHLFESEEPTPPDSEAISEILQEDISDAAKLQRIANLVKPPTGGAATNNKDEDMEIKDLTLAKLVESRPDLLEQYKGTLSKDAATVKLQEDLNAAKKTIDELTAKQNLQARQATIETKLTEAKLPDVLVTDVFRTQLLEAKDDKAIDALIEERKTLAKSVNPNAPKAKETKLSESAGTNSNKDKKDDKGGNGNAALPDVKQFASGFKRGAPTA